MTWKKQGTLEETLAIFWTNGDGTARRRTRRILTTDDPAHGNDAPSQCQVPRREEGLRLPLQACPHRRFRCWQVLPPSAICREFLFLRFCLAKTKKMTRNGRRTTSVEYKQVAFGETVRVALKWSVLSGWSECMVRPVLCLGRGDHSRIACLWEERIDSCCALFSPDVL